MKKTLIAFITLVTLSLPVLAQKEVTKFLGIPVDGTKKEMTARLQAKGYEWNKRGKCLVGNLDGRAVKVYLETNDGKVCRVKVVDAKSSDANQIKEQYNNLCLQFKSSGKYKYFNRETMEIAADENVEAAISVKEKEYKAVFYQDESHPKKSAVEKDLLNKAVQKKLMDEYGLDLQQFISTGANPSEKEAQPFLDFLAKGLNFPIEKIENIQLTQMANEFTRRLAKYSTDVYNDVKKNGMKDLQQRTVWFEISKDGNKYYITTCYDNGYNCAQSED